MRKINADHHTYKITKDGIEDFYWPITHKSMTLFGERFFYQSADVLKNYPDQDQAIIYKFCMKYFIAIAGGIFQSDLLKTRLHEDNTILEVPKEWAVWPYTILNNTAPPHTSFIETLKRRKKNDPLSKKIQRVIKSLSLLRKMRLSPRILELDGLKVSPMTPHILETKTISTQRTPLISRQAKSSDEDVLYFRSDRWFQFISDDELGISLEKNSTEIETILIEIVKSIYAEQQVSSSSFVEMYLRKVLTETAALLRIHYDRLLKRNDLPTRLWTGTGGQIWDLMLRSAVIKKGGHVTGFDHGGGTAHVSIPLVGFIELWACHEFITFNARQALDIQAAAPNWPCLDHMRPIVKSVSDKSRPPEIFIKPPFLGLTPKIKKVFVLSTLYDQDRGRSFAFYPDLAYVDWQARLLGKLKDWGYDVYFKPHPESRSAPHVDFHDVIDAHIVYDKFEDILHEADLFIIDYTYTSILIPAFLTNIPIILIDFDNLPWHKNAYKLIQKRAALIECEFDQKNRISLDWNHLKSAIDISIEKCNNHEYARAYYI